MWHDVLPKFYIKTHVKLREITMDCYVAQCIVFACIPCLFLFYFLAVRCPELPDVARASYTTIPNPTYNTLARYLCDLGYRVDDNQNWVDVYCTSTGVWVPDPATITCESKLTPRINMKVFHRQQS